MKATAVATMASLRGPRLGSVLGGGGNQRERGSKESSGGTVAGVNGADDPRDSLAKRSELNIEVTSRTPSPGGEPAGCLNASHDARGTWGRAKSEVSRTWEVAGKLLGSSPWASRSRNPGCRVRRERFGRF